MTFMNTVLLLLFAVSGVYVPSATHVRVTNPTSNVATIDMDGKTILLGPLEPYETAGNVRISSHESFEVRAWNETANAIATVPVLDLREALDAGFVPRAYADGWRSTIGIVNPHDAPVVVTFGSRSVDVAPNGVVSVDVEGSSFTATRPVLVFVEDVHATSGARVITKARASATSSRRRAVRSGPVIVPQPQKQTVTLTPSKDATLFEIGNGSLANGAGIHLFAGATNSNARRRALLQFDIASQIPAGSRVTSATLSMQVSMTISGAEPMRLHAVTKSWGEGSSDAGDSRDGGGTTARTGDATWIHTSFNSTRWTTPGGDFNATADATANVGFGTGTWESLTSRVQAWVDQPASNFGWIVIGNESRGRTAKRFDSREVAGETKPRLVVEFER